MNSRSHPHKGEYNPMPTIREAIENALEALAHSGFPKGGAVYDDLAEVIHTLETTGNLGALEERLTA